MRIARRAALLLTIGGLVAAFEVAPAMAQIQIQPGTGARTIRVAGMGQVRVEPDLATIQFAVETTGRTAREAGEQNADLMERVIQALLQAGVTRQDVQTSGFSVHPEYARSPRGDDIEPPVIRGYRAMNMVSVRTRDLERIGALIDSGLQAGANRMHGVSFELTNSQAAEAQALREAVLEARSAAETIAAALGVTLGPVLDASTTAQPPRPYFRGVEQAMVMDMAGVGAAAAPTPIEPGQQMVMATASVVFEIR